MWACLILALGGMGLVLFWGVYTRQRSENPDFNPLRLQLGASGMLLGMIVILLATGDSLFSIPPLIVLGMIWTQRLTDSVEMGMALKLGFSGILLVIIVWASTMGPIGYVFAFGALCILAMLWIGPMLDLVGGKAIDSVMGGGGEVEAQPLYSVAHTKQKQGDAKGAIAWIDKELEEFPGDFEGQLLKAEIQMDSLKDFDAARATVLAITEQDHHEPGQVSRAMGRLADWQLKHRQDGAGARQTLQWLRERYPESAVEFVVSQRLARMDFIVDINDPRDVSELVSECLKQLVKHPLDNDTREKLARIYFERYEQPELAKEQMKILFAQPYQQPRDIARWLNLMADWHLKKDNLDAARKCLQQIVAQFPDQPYSDEAQLRLTRLNT